MTINNNIQDKRYIGVGNKSIKDGIPAQRTYELTFTALIQDDTLFHELLSQTENATDGTTNLINLKFTKPTGTGATQESMQIRLQDYHLSSANITEIEFITTSFSKAAGGTFSMRVRFDEEVTVDTSGGTPHFVINNTTDAARHQTCLYASGSGTNELVFSKTLGANSADINASDVLNVIADSITLNSGFKT